MTTGESPLLYVFLHYFFLAVATFVVLFLFFAHTSSTSASLLGVHDVIGGRRIPLCECIPNLPMRVYVSTCSTYRNLAYASLLEKAIYSLSAHGWPAVPPQNFTAKDWFRELSPKHQ